MANSKKKPTKKAAPKKKAVKKAAEPPVMNNESLKEVVQYHLRSPNLNKQNIPVDDSTVLNTILSPTDGYGTSNSQDIFRYFIEYTFDQNGFTVPAFPEGWPSMNVSEFVNALLPTT